MVGFVNGDGPHAFFSIDSTNNGGPVSYYISPQIVPPAAAPAPIRAQVVPGGVRLSWRPVQGATRYEIWRGQPKTLLGSTTGTSYLDARAPRGKALSYAIRARNASGPGPFSSPTISRRSGK
jgi:hypothetical protein